MDFNHLTKENIDEINKIFYRYEKTIPNNIDVILVLGGTKLRRADAGCEAYFKIKKPIVFSGGFKKENLSEAELYANRALENGVPKEDIIIEKSSSNTYENFFFSFPIIMNLLKKEPINILVVTSSVHMVRSLNYGNKIINENNFPMKLFPYPGDGEISANNWFKSENMRNFIEEELGKIKEQKIID